MVAMSGVERELDDALSGRRDGFDPPDKWLCSQVLEMRSHRQIPRGGETPAVPVAR